MNEPARPAPQVMLSAVPNLPATSASVLAWFEAAVSAPLPRHDGTLATARDAAKAYARRAKAVNTRRAYIASVRAWCGWCARHGLTPLPASGADVAAFLSDEALQGRSMATIGLRRAAIRYLHTLGDQPVPTGDAQVSEAVAGIARDPAILRRPPAKKMPARVAVMRQMLDAIQGDALPELRDRALLLTGFAGALRRAELAAIEVEHLEDCEGGLLLLLPASKGDRDGKGVKVPLPYGGTELCPVRALRRWLAAAGIASGPVFRRLQPAKPVGALPGDGQAPARRWTLGRHAISDRTVARVVQARAAAALLNPAHMGGHSLKRGALTTGMDNNAHPMRLKTLGRHKSWDVLEGYLEMGEPFSNHALKGVL